jgi:hypothetical protein
MFHFDDLTLDCPLDVSIVRQIHHVGTGNTACIGSSEIHLLARNFGGTVGIAQALLALLALLPVMVLTGPKNRDFVTCDVNYQWSFQEAIKNGGTYKI